MRRNCNDEGKQKTYVRLDRRPSITLMGRGAKWVPTMVSPAQWWVLVSLPFTKLWAAATVARLAVATG